MKLSICTAPLLALAVFEASAQSTVDPAQPYVWGANIGWLNAHPSTGDGVRTTDAVCSGYIWGSNVGWIHLGDGTPADGIRYSNSASDHGVNVMSDGSLRGYAWGANIGWINFEATGNPRIDLATGDLLGHAWSANAGWLALGAYGARVTTLAITDSDTDGISDAWEKERAPGFPATLGTPGDADLDGQSDLAEFEADTDPLDPSDRLRVLSISRGSLFTDLVFTSRTTRFYQVTTRTGLSGEWTNVGTGDIAGQAGTTPVSFLSSASPRRFYRVETRRPLSSP